MQTIRLRNERVPAVTIHPGASFLAVPLAFAGILLSALVSPVLAAEVSCRFKAETERTDVTIVSQGQRRWSGTVEKDKIATVSIPEGAFTVHSKVFNPNLQTKGDIRTEAHTKMCRDDVALSVPLFPDDIHPNQR